MTMTIGQVQILRDSAAEAGDSEASGGNYFPRVVVKLADTTLDLHAQLQQEREGREKLRKALGEVLLSATGVEEMPGYTPTYLVDCRAILDARAALAQTDSERD